MIFFLYIFVHGRASSLVCLKRHNSSGFCDSKAAGNMLKSAGFRGEVKKKNLTLQPKLSGFLVKLSRFYVLVGGLFVKFLMRNLTSRSSRAYSSMRSWSVAARHTQYLPRQVPPCQDRSTSSGIAPKRLFFF